MQGGGASCVRSVHVLKCTLVVRPLRADPSTGGVGGLQLETLGRTPQPSCLAYLDSGVVFVGSALGDSQLVRCGMLPLLVSRHPAPACRKAPPPNQGPACTQPAQRLPCMKFTHGIFAGCTARPPTPPSQRRLWRFWM